MCQGLVFRRLGELDLPWEECAFEKDIDEDVGIIYGGSRIERRSKDFQVSIHTFCFLQIIYPGMVGSTVSAPAIECDERRATTSSGENPTEAKRDNILSTLSNGSGTRSGGDAALGCGRPRRNWTRGAPGQLARLSAPANWILQGVGSLVKMQKIEYLQVSRCQDMRIFMEERTKVVEDVVQAIIGRERQLSLIEDEDGSISTSAAI